MAAWWIDRVLPGLIDSLPFVLIVGLGLQFHLRAAKKHVDQVTQEQTQKIVEELKGPPR